MKDFTEAEITLPINIEELSEADVELTKINKSVDENMWMQIVSSRQLNPPINDEENQMLKSTINRLSSDFDAILSETYREDIQKETVIKSMIYNTTNNVMRLSQSFARAENRGLLSEFDFSKARNLIVDNFGEFVNHPNFARIEFQVRNRKNDLRFSVVQTFLINNPKTTVHEIYESVKPTELFQDLTDLQGLLDWIQKRGHAWVDRDRKYEWI